MTKTELNIPKGSNDIAYRSVATCIFSIECLVNLGFNDAAEALTKSFFGDPDEEQSQIALEILELNPELYNDKAMRMIHLNYETSRINKDIWKS